MADISIPGLNSKYKTDELVKNLVEVEKAKLVTMEESIDKMKDEKKIWQGFNRKLNALRTSSRSLYGFENPFNNKIVESGSEKILTATASRNAENQDLKLTVLKTAEADKFLSPPLPVDEKVPPGLYTFNVGDKSISLKYRGGKLSDFAKRLDNKAENLLNLRVVKNSPDSQVILFEAGLPGKDNTLRFTGDSLKWALDKKILKPVLSGNFPVLFKEKGEEARENLNLPSGAKARIVLPKAVPVHKGMILEYRLTVKELNKEENIPQAPPLPTLPETEPGRFQGLEIQSYGAQAEIPEWTPPPAPPLVRDPQIGSFEGSGSKMKLPPLPETSNEEHLIKVPLPPSMTSIESFDFENRNSLREVNISDMRITDPSVLDGYAPENPLSRARDALIDFNGIKVRRNSNDIEDLIPGLTLHLHRADPHEEVELKVKPDTESAKEGIIKFVYNYNQAMTEILILSTDNGEVIDEIEYYSDEEREAAQEKLGSFRGDISLMQLKNRLQRITSAPYPTYLERKLSMLSQIGISTNAGVGNGGSVNFSKLRGYLEINEEKLDDALQSENRGIRELFGQDTDGDLVIDSGLGYKMDTFLNPYVQSGGILANRMGQIEKRIDRTNDDIDDYKKYLADYEQDLKRKYGAMEGMLNQLEKSSTSLDRFNQQNNK